MHYLLGHNRVCFYWLMCYWLYHSQAKLGKVFGRTTLVEKFAHNSIGVVKGGLGGYALPNFQIFRTYSHFVLWKRRYPEQNRVIRLKSNISPPEFFGPSHIFGLATLVHNSYEICNVEICYRLVHHQSAKALQVLHRQTPKSGAGHLNQQCWIGHSDTFHLIFKKENSSIDLCIWKPLES